MPNAILGVTVSIGLASAKGQASEINGVLRVVDEALYAAKRQGKNRIVWQTYVESAATSV